MNILNLLIIIDKFLGQFDGILLPIGVVEARGLFDTVVTLVPIDGRAHLFDPLRFIFASAGSDIYSVNLFSMVKFINI